MLSFVNVFRLKKHVKGAGVMVRSVQGSKLKNIKNLILDCLEDVDPAAICIHAGTNNIGSGDGIEEIVSEYKELVSLLLGRGILPIISMITVRNDKHSEMVDLVNERLRVVCDTMGAGCIEHDGIKSEHLNTSKLHIARQFNYILNEEFIDYFNYAILNNFWND